MTDDKLSEDEKLALLSVYYLAIQENPDDPTSVAVPEHMIQDVFESETIESLREKIDVLQQIQGRRSEGDNR